MELKGIFAAEAISLKMKTYEVHASTHKDCSSAVRVFSKEDPEYLEMTTIPGPHLARGELKDGTGISPETGTSAGSAATPNEQKVAIYISTGSTATTEANAFLPPTSSSDSTKGFKLNGAAWLLFFYK